MKIMVSYSDAVLSKSVVKEAQRHAQAWSASIEVVNAVERVDPIRRSRLEEMEAQFEAEVMGLFDGVSIPYTAQMQVDDIGVGEKIVRIAKRKKVDLIFIGLKRKSKVGKLLFGSTAQYIILNAPCPVVTVRPDLK